MKVMQLPSWIKLPPGMQRQEAEALVNQAFSVMYSPSMRRPVGILYMDLEEWRWSKRRLDVWRAQSQSTIELQVMAYTWSQGEGRWKKEGWDVAFTQAVFDSIARGHVDFLEEKAAFPIAPLPRNEYYWAICEFFPSGSNDGVRPL